MSSSAIRADPEHATLAAIWPSWRGFGHLALSHNSSRSRACGTKHVFHFGDREGWGCFTTLLTVVIRSRGIQPISLESQEILYGKVVACPGIINRQYRECQAHKTRTLIVTNFTNKKPGKTNIFRDARGSLFSPLHIHALSDSQKREGPPSQDGPSRFAQPGSRSPSAPARYPHLNPRSRPSPTARAFGRSFDRCLAHSEAARCA